MDNAPPSLVQCKKHLLGAEGWDATHGACLILFLATGQGNFLEGKYLGMDALERSSEEFHTMAVLTGKGTLEPAGKGSGDYTAQRRRRRRRDGPQ